MVLSYQADVTECDSGKRSINSWELVRACSCDSTSDLGRSSFGVVVQVAAAAVEVEIVSEDSCF